MSYFRYMNNKQAGKGGGDGDSGGASKKPDRPSGKNPHK